MTWWQSFPNWKNAMYDFTTQLDRDRESERVDLESGHPSSARRSLYDDRDLAEAHDEAADDDAGDLHSVMNRPAQFDESFGL